MKLVCGALVVVLAIALAGCDQRTKGPKKPKPDDDLSTGPVAAPQQPMIAEWDGRSFLTKQDVEAMGANMKSPDPLNYSRLGDAHAYKMGLDELQMWIWACTSDGMAAQRLEGEKRDDTNSCTLLKAKAKASLAEVIDSGIGGNSYARRVIRVEGQGNFSYVVQHGRYVVKMTYGDSCPGVSTLNEFAGKAKKALDYVLAKLR